MSTKDTGGPAFPDPQEDWRGEKGMTLRDWFAGKALVGLLSGQYDTSSQFNLTEVPAEAYKIADAMLAERSK